MKMKTGRGIEKEGGRNQLLKIWKIVSTNFFFRKEHTLYFNQPNSTF